MPHTLLLVQAFLVEGWAWQKPSEPPESCTISWNPPQKTLNPIRDNVACEEFWSNLNNPGGNLHFKL